MKRAFYELSVSNPGAVAWYCGLKLEMAVHLVMNVLTDALRDPSTPGLPSLRKHLSELLHRKVGPDVDVQELPDLQHLGTVDDFYVSFEWSDGGLVHVHVALWVVGAPRIDQVVVPKEDKDKGVVEIPVHMDGGTVMPQEEAATLMAAFWERAYTEFNLAKTLHAGTDAEADHMHALAEDTGPRIKLGRKQERQRPSPESVSYMISGTVYSTVSAASQSSNNNLVGMS